MKIYSLQKNKSRQILSLSKGFTLVEALVSISVLTMSVLGLMSILASSISDTANVKNKIKAEYFAQEGIECARNTRDTYVLYPAAGRSWDSFIALNSNNIICPNTELSFTRTITKTQISTDEVKIESTVTWNQGSGPRSVIFSENLFNWIEL
ncbi:MAG: prepilin-type N-terminal cleavage/methylation domain-containing protein [Candidatus Paceibacterota bacterium]|jgi:Tfp pilus assembly protein PilV